VSRARRGLGDAEEANTAVSSNTSRRRHSRFISAGSRVRPAPLLAIQAALGHTGVQRLAGRT
jgi:hypothetical protein